VTLAKPKVPKIGLRANWLALVALPLIFQVDDSLAQRPAEATVSIDASLVEGEISPTLYGQFDEFMFGGIKGGLGAELVQDRSFDGAPNAIGLPRYWERDPDDRNDDPALHFHWDAEVFYPPNRPAKADVADHSLRIDLAYDDGQRRGIRQGGIPIRKGLGYIGYLWAKTEEFRGGITVVLEADRTGGERYASAEIHDVQGAWRKYEFVLTPTTDDPLAKLAILFHGKGRL
jgi:hypothetical protein